MPPEYISILLLLGFFLLIILRVPVAVSLALASLVGILLADLNIYNYVIKTYRGVDIFTILAVPLFLLTGFLASTTSIATRLLDFCVLVVGRLRGALGHINVLVSMLFAGITGSATADTTGIGSVLIPIMIRRGYSPAYSVAITAITSTIGVIIPPSVVMVVYGAYASVSVGAMFIGGIIPGILLGFGCMLYNHVYTTRNNIDLGLTETAAKDQALLVRSFSETVADPGSTEAGQALSASHPKNRRSAMKVILGALPSAGIPLIILWGVTGGLFTATEAGLIAFLYALLLVVVVYREITLSRLHGILKDALKFYSLPVICAGTAVLFGWVLAYYGMGEALRNMVEALNVPGWLFLIVVFAVFLVVGTFMDGFPAIVLFAPIFLEPAYAVGIHPIQLGMVVTLTLALGLTTPPYGLCLLIACKLANENVLNSVATMLPFWLIAMAVIALCIFMPQIVLFLPRLVMPNIF